MLGRESRTASDQREGGDEDVDKHGPTPIEEIRQCPSQKEADGGPDSAGRTRDRKGARAFLRVDEGVVDESKDCRGEKGAEDSLGRPGSGQYREGGSQAPDETRHGESYEADRIGPPNPDDSNKAPAEKHEPPESQRVGRDDPWTLGGGHAEVLLHFWQSHGNDRHVEHDHQLGGDDACEDCGFVPRYPAV